MRSTTGSAPIWMPRAISTVEGIGRLRQVIDLVAEGRGAQEVADRLGVGVTTVYTDLKRYRVMAEFMLQQEGRLTHLMSKSNKVIARAWAELARPMAPAQAAPLLAQINAAIATQARLLGVDGAAAGAPPLESLTIIVEGGGAPVRVTLGPAAPPGAPVDAPADAGGEVIDLPALDAPDSGGLNREEPPNAGGLTLGAGAP